MNTTSSKYSTSQPMNRQSTSSSPMQYNSQSTTNYNPDPNINYNNNSNTMYQPNTTVYNPNLLPEESVYSNHKFRTFSNDDSSNLLPEESVYLNRKSRFLSNYDSPRFSSDEPIPLKNIKKKNKNRYVEDESDNPTKIKWSRYFKGIVIYTLLFLIMSHIKMNSFVCGFIPYLNNHEILCMTIKGVIMSILIIIIQKLY